MAAELIEEAPWIDVVVVGEGDQTVVELVKALEDGSDLDQVAGIAFRNGRRRWGLSSIISSIAGATARS